jgi:hypothetical protein
MAMEDAISIPGKTTAPHCFKETGGILWYVVDISDCSITYTPSVVREQ